MLKIGQAAPRCEAMCARGEVEDEAGDLSCLICKETYCASHPSNSLLVLPCEEREVGSLISKIPSGAHGLHFISSSL